MRFGLVIFSKSESNVSLLESCLWLGYRDCEIGLERVFFSVAQGIWV